MARALVTVTALRKAIPTEWTLLTQTAADVTNDQYIPLMGGEIIIAWNSGASQRNLVLTSVADTRLQRTGNISATIEADEVKAVRITNGDGWAQSSDNGRLWFEADNAEVMFMVIRPTA